MPLPVPNSTTSFWRARPHKLDNHRSSPDLPPTTDILIIGAGFSGVACAYYLTKDVPSPAPSITLLEARELCSGASGRNGGHVKPDTYYNMPKYTELFGAEVAASIASYEASQLYAVKELVEQEDIHCDFHLTRATDVFLDAEAAKDAERAFRQLQRDGAVNLRDVQYINNPTSAARVSGVKGALSAFTFTAGQLYPYKLVTSLLELAMSRGNINLQTNTPVTSVSPTPDSKGYYTVTTPRGTLRASKVLICTNAYTSSILPQLRSRIIPVRGIACCIATTPDPATAPRLPTTYALRFNAGLMDYLIQRPADNSIIVGGARETFIQDLSSWYDNVSDDKLISSAAGRYFDGYMQRHFAGWEDSGARVDRIWTGIMGYSADAVPFVGDVPGTNKGLYVIGGFTGHGMPAILGCAKGVAEEIQMESKGPEGVEGRLWKGLRILPTPFRITEERMQSKANVVLDEWGRTWGGEGKIIESSKSKS
jgi:glycine/D-amino acid oxidase-like deaminating enzyme